MSRGNLEYLLLHKKEPQKNYFLILKVHPYEKFQNSNCFKLLSLKHLNCYLLKKIIAVLSL